MIRIGMLALFAVVASSMPAARASPSCMSLAEARAGYPGRHLFWHGRGHCWDDRAGRPARSPLPPAPTKDNTRLSIIYPAVMRDDRRFIEPALLDAAPATSGPLLIDIDALTAEPASIERDQAASFAERWAPFATVSNLAGEQ